MASRRNVVALLVLVAALALALGSVVSGCGGSSDSSGDDAAIETTTETTETETTEEATETEETDTDTDTGLGALADEDCIELAGIGAKLGEAMAALGGQNTDVGAIADVFDELVGSAPDEIKDDLEVLAGGVAEMAKALEGVDFSSGSTPNAEQLAKLQEAIASIDTPALTEASTNVEKWATANCSNS
jgi:hypothetical protein